MGVVLITGCGSGFGLLTAVEAARRGHTVYAGLRRLASEARLREAAEGLPIRTLELDVTVPEHRDAALARIHGEEGRLDGLVNNAGRALGGFLETVEEDEVRAVFEVNVFAVWAMTRACLPMLRSAGNGTIIMMSSMSGRMGLPGLGVYASSKFALEGMTEAWRHELAPFGVRVVLVEPGPYRTDIFGRNRHVARGSQARQGPYAARTAFIDQHIARPAAEHAGDPADVARKVCDLLVARTPGLRHPMGRGAKVRDIAARVMPFRLLERLVRRFSEPPKPRRAK